MISLRFALLLLTFNLTYAYGALAATVGQPAPLSILLTPDESRYLALKKEITFCVDPDWMPFEAIREGQLDGMTSDYSDLFAKRLGVPFRFVPTTSWAQSQDWAKAGICDILPMIPITNKSINYLTFTDPYLSYSVGIIAANKLPFISGLGDLSSYPVGIVKGYSTWEYALENFPQNKFVSVEGVEDGLLKVSSGKITAFLIAVPVAVHNIKELGLSNLKVAGHIQVNKELRIGVSRQVPELAPIIKKLTASLTKEDIDGVYHKWVALRFEQTVTYNLLWKIGAALVIVMTGIALWNRKLSRLNKKILLRDKELRAAKERAEQYLHIAGTIIVALDDKARVQLINKKGRLLIGSKEGDIIGKDWVSNFIPIEQRAEVSEAFDLIIKGALPHVEHFENEIMDSNGNHHLISWHNSILINDEGKIVGTLSSGEDITERRNSEIELLATKNEAEQANIAKTKFLATASHDLRQPLQAAHLFLYVLGNKEQQPENREIISNIEASVASLDNLLNSLLDISRLEAGLIKPVMQSVPISAMIKHLTEEYSLIAKEEGIMFKSVIPNVVVYTDLNLLESILRNLISNALKHVDHGKVLLGCRRHGDNITIEVWDNGIGIPEGRLTDIFAEFIQVGNEGRDRSKGLGLGLSIVEKLAGLLGHRINVRSWEGNGSAFTIELPLAHEKEISDKSKDTHAVPLLTKGAVFIIDDEAAIRHSLSLVLEQKGYEVHATSGDNCQECKKSASEMTTQPDVIIADYRLQNGYTGTKAIKCLREMFKKDIPAVLLTGDTAPDRLVEAKQSGLPILHKPINVDDLMQQIANAIKSGE